MFPQCMKLYLRPTFHYNIKLGPMGRKQHRRAHHIFGRAMDILLQKPRKLFRVIRGDPADHIEPRSHQPNVAP